jgi:hypothetical protein
MKNPVTLGGALLGFILLLFTASSEGSRYGYEWFPIIPRYQAISVYGTISGDAMSETRIEPFEKIFAGRFTRVYWSNFSDIPIRIKFGNGTECKDISGAPQRTQRWRLSKECYITEKAVPPDGVLQITFDEQGTYKYEIQFVGTNSKETGELIVF